MENGFLLRAAIAGILGATAVSAASPAFAAADDAAKGHCVGANSCKGKSGCAQKGHNDCAGKNGCGGKGFLETTKAECEALAMKDKKIHFVAVKK
jgi:uncharacterized membrane protein